MPTYEYECQKCGRIIEVFQRMVDEPLTEVKHTVLGSDKAVKPTCYGNVKRLIGKGSGIIFKGTGFWQTDYKKKKGKPDKREQ